MFRRGLRPTKFRRGFRRGLRCTKFRRGLSWIKMY